MNTMVYQQILTSCLRIANKSLLMLKPARETCLPGPQTGHEYMLYVHIPFCEALCSYCSFNRYVLDVNQAHTYFENLRLEMQMTARLGYTFHSMYIGGGTPTILMDELCQVIDLARDLFGVTSVSCETNPNHLTPRLIEQLDNRVQRMSVGVQTFDSGLLKRINRLERFGTGEETLKRIDDVAGGFQCLNVDMIFNFPTQTKEILLQDIQKVLESGANQITYYPLMVSPSVKHSLSSSVGKVDYSREAEYYELIVQNLSRQFELSTAWTFSRKGGMTIDEYIVDTEEYVGLGSGAFSYLDGTLFVNTFSLDEYRRTIEAGKMSVFGMRSFGLHEMMCYQLMMSLFGLKLDKQKFKERFGSSLESSLPFVVAFLNLTGALENHDPNNLYLTPKGRYLGIVMMREFFSGINRVRDQARQAVVMPILGM